MRQQQINSGLWTPSPLGSPESPQEQQRNSRLFTPDQWSRVRTMEQRAPLLHGAQPVREESSGNSTQEAVQAEVRRQLRGIMGQLQQSQLEAEALRGELQVLRAQTVTQATHAPLEVHAFASPPDLPQHLRKATALPIQDRDPMEVPVGQPQVYGGYLHGQTALQAPTTSSHGQTALQAPTTSSHGQTALQAPTTSSHGQTALQAPITSSHGQTALQAPTTSSHGQTALRAPSASLQDVARTALRQTSRGVGEQAVLAEDLSREGQSQENLTQVTRQRSRSPNGHPGGSFPSMAAASDPMVKLLEGLEKVINGKSRGEDFGKGPTELPKLPEVSEAASMEILWQPVFGNDLVFEILCCARGQRLVD